MAAGEGCFRRVAHCRLRGLLPRYPPARLARAFAVSPAPFLRDLWHNAVAMTNLAAAAPASDDKRPVMTRNKPGQSPRKVSTLPAIFLLLLEAA